MIASSPVRMQDQNPSMLQASAVQIHHQFVHHESTAGVLQSQSTVPAASMSWSAAGGPPCLPSQVVDYTAQSTSSLILDDVSNTSCTAAFQQLLDSFGCQSDVDDDVDDDTVVNLDDSVPLRSVRHHQQQRLQSIIQPQLHAVCSAATC